MEIHRLWVSSFFRQGSKFNVHFKNEEKNWDKLFCFWDNSISSGCVNLSLIRREYLPSGVNVLTNSLKVLHSTNIDFFQLNYVHNDQWIWQKSRRPRCNTVWARLPCCLWKGPLKKDFSDIYLITFYRVRNFGNTSPMSMIFFSKMLKI